MMNEISLHFMKHVSEHGLSFATTAEYEAREAIFGARHSLIEESNANPENTFKLAHNMYSTWTDAELNKLRGFRAATRNVAEYENNTPNADSVNWVTAGCVTPVKDQGNCGSCWSFSTTGSMEGAHCVATGNLVSLSESQLVDCDTNDGNMGCNGGDMQTAMVWTQSNPLATETQYPYKARDQSCNTSEEALGKVGCTSEVVVTVGSSSALMASIEVAPTSIAIEADKLVFQFYTSGVLNSSKCGTNLDHGVLAVGYGTDSTGQAYYLVKNSWNTSWGDQGYIKIANNGDGDGICGIQMDPVRAVTN
jgi:cathepsin L